MFSLKWWHLFSEAWLSHSADLSSFGVIRGVDIVVDRERFRVVWSHSGRQVEVTAVLCVSDGRPTFIATKSIWKRFVYEGVPAATLLMTGSMTYEGPVAFFLRWGPKFAILAQVGSRVPRDDENDDVKSTGD